MFLPVRFWTWWRKDRAVGEPFIQTVQFFLASLALVSSSLLLQMLMPHTPFEEAMETCLKTALLFAHLSLPLFKTIRPCLQEIPMYYPSIIYQGRI